ncbi:MAG TPA: hypothetical protein VJ011_10710 [Steroidobacteraceae bacterium]|nr:hypothetical protein [Steroidobacteraceae bacterium]
MLVLAIAIAGLFFGEEATRGEIVERLAGSSARTARVRSRR